MLKKISSIIIVLFFLNAAAQPVYAASIGDFNIAEFIRGLWQDNTNQNTQEQQQADENLLLPDLQASQPQELYITQEADGKKIRFSTTTFNSGLGELRLLGQSDTEDEVTNVTQIIQSKDGNETQHEVGTFIFHPEHDHWHVEQFTQFQLWNMNEDNTRNEMVRATDKMSFCLWDEERYDPSLENSPEESQFPSECTTEIQGISPGWSDTYSASLAGQELDISGVANGTYIIRTVINPDEKIKESDYENNAVEAYVEISNDTIRVLDMSE